MLTHVLVITVVLLAVYISVTRESDRMDRGDR
jgi:hypothetical protein